MTKNSAIKLGFEKEKGANGSIGKMSKFFLDLNLPAGENNRTFGIELAITDLKSATIKMQSTQLSSERKKRKNTAQ